MSLKRVSVGDPVSISAAAYNAWCDAAEDFQNRRMSQDGNRRPERRDADIVLVRNDSGGDVGRFGVLGINAPIITPEDNLDEFKRRVALSGVTPADGHVDSFAILLEPLADGAMGEAIISGVVQVPVAVGSAADDVCGAEAGDVAKLKSGVGSNRILWKQAGTGTKWAVVRIGGGGGVAEGLKFAKLDAELSAGGSTTASIWSGDPLADSGEDVTVYDWWLPAGESLAGGTKIGITQISGKWYVLCAWIQKTVVVDVTIDEGKLKTKTAKIVVFWAGANSDWSGGTDVFEEEYFTQKAFITDVSFDGHDFYAKSLTALIYNPDGNPEAGPLKWADGTECAPE